MAPRSREAGTRLPVASQRGLVSRSRAGAVVRRLRRALAVVAVALATRATGQNLGSLAAPGPLNKVHASLESLTGCVKCHEPDKTVVAARCLSCHVEVRSRIAAGKGLHRAVTSTCVPCHVEHAGRNVELRPLDRKRFDHADRTGFPLEGRHAAIATDCARCHKTRSFLNLNPACASCHQDKHKGQLGADCSRCHSAKIPFAETRRGFDHGKAAFVLTGAHLTVRCELCHKLGVYKGIASSSCADCHKSPHARPLGTCSTCHTTLGFRTGLQAGMIDHATTSFPLLGRHATAPCASCHGPSTARRKPGPASCATCHPDAHRGLFKESCSPCHREAGPGGPPFDHRVRTGFPLEGKHAEQPCTKCHKPAASQPGETVARRIVDFRGAKPVCAACHVDPHAGKLGASCEKCHDPRAFRLGTFKHPRFPEFFVNRHEPAGACEKCHRPAPAGSPRRFKGTSLACGSCHADPHLGQVGSSCKPCHVPGGPKFAVVGFDHARARFPLTGKHAGLRCDACHKLEEGSFPSGPGKAVRLTGLSRECRSCHKDVHRPSLGDRCEKCHSTTTFVVKRYTHKETGGKCISCHRPAYESARSPVHAAAGFSGPCETCHRISDPSWSLGTYTHASWPLLGAHDRVSCAGCHASGVYRDLPSACVSCHLEEYQRSQRPNHVAKGLSTECATCHKVSDTDWSLAAQRAP